MRQCIKVGIILGIMLILIWSLNPCASASEWSEGILAEVKGYETVEGKTPDPSNIQLMMQGGNFYQLDPKVKIKDTGGSPISLDMLPFPSRIRFLAVKSVIKEIILIEVSPR